MAQVDDQLEDAAGNLYNPNSRVDDQLEDAAGNLYNPNLVSYPRAGKVGIPQGLSAPIVTRPNPLSQFNGYNYSISIYILNIDDYRKIVQTQKKILLPTTQLIIQSGGIQETTQPRNQFFDVDFYIDNLKLVSLVGTQNSNRSHNTANLDFSVIEPTGVTFIQRLRKAVRAHVKQGTNTSEMGQNFLMIIRFYPPQGEINKGPGDGFLQPKRSNYGPFLGNLTAAGIGSRMPYDDEKSDRDAIIEKWIPFTIVNITYRLAQSATEYRVSAVCPHVSVGYGTMRSTIPFDFELQSQDVATLLNGNTQVQQTNLPIIEERRDSQRGSPPNASRSVKTYVNGLAQALNQHQQYLIQEIAIPGTSTRKPQQQKIADQFEIRLAPVQGLQDAKLTPNKITEKDQTVTRPPATGAQALGQNVGYDPKQRPWVIRAGTPIVQVIDMVLRNSTYITNQQDSVWNSHLQTWEPQSTGRTVMWYRIGVQLDPIGYDDKRGMMAYKYIYFVTPYQINNPRTPRYPENDKPRGVHKKYDYTFTGTNTEVIDFNFDVNLYYYTTFGKNTPANRSNLSVGDAATAVIPQQNFAAKVNQESTGADDESNMMASQLANRLYSPLDVARSKLTILGDPDWIQQSEVFYNSPPPNTYYVPFMPDGSINTAASEILYEVKISTIDDYDLRPGEGTGLAKASNSTNSFYGVKSSTVVSPTETSIFAATICTSNFRQGQFTQEIEGIIRLFPSQMPTYAPAPPAPAKKLTTMAEWSDGPAGSPRVVNDDRGPIDVF